MPKSLYISQEVSNFNGTEIEIWAGFGQVGNTEKKNWVVYEGVFFTFSWAKKLFKNIVASPQKSCINEGKKTYFFS